MPERVLAGRLAAYVVHSRYESRELTKAAREAFRSKFEREVDPTGGLPVEEGPRRAEMARKAHVAGLALKSAQVRGMRRERSERAQPPTIPRTWAQGWLNTQQDTPTTTHKGLGRLRQ